MAHGRTAVFPTSVVALASGVSNVGSLPRTATKQHVACTSRTTYTDSRMIHHRKARGIVEESTRHPLPDGLV